VTRGYVLCNSDLTEVVCLSSDKTSLVMAPVDSTMVLNKAICLHDVTEAKNILKRFRALPEYKEIIEKVEINNVARLYNKFF